MFDSGQIMQTITCSICSCVTTREEPFSKLLVQFPDSHHEATLTNQKCTLNSFIQHQFKPEDFPDYECLTCGKRTLATWRIQISCYPVILCILLGRKMNDETRIILAVNYPIINLNPCPFYRLHEGTVDSKYNLIATVNHKPSKKNDGHYMAMNKSLTLRSWYRYDNDIVNLINFWMGTLTPCSWMSRRLLIFYFMSMWNMSQFPQQPL